MPRTLKHPVAFPLNVYLFSDELIAFTEDVPNFKGMLCNEFEFDFNLQIPTRLSFLTCALGAPGSPIWLQRPPPWRG